jgi:hypothetical protein
MLNLHIGLLTIATDLQLNHFLVFRILDQFIDDKLWIFSITVSPHNLPFEVAQPPAVAPLQSDLELLQVVC